MIATDRLQRVRLRGVRGNDRERLDHFRCARANRPRAQGRYPHYKPGWEDSLPVVFGLADDKGFPNHGKVVSVAAKIDPQTHAQRWQAVADKDGALKPGTSVRVRVITSAPHKALLIHGIACGGNGDEQWVHMLNSRNAVELRKVKLGRAYDWFLAVDEGLKADDWILCGRDPYGKSRNIVGKEIKPERIATPPPPWAAISAGPSS